MDFLQKVQNKPKHIRVQILWLSVIVSMAVIFYFWVASLKSSLSVEVEKPKAVGEASQSLEEIKEELPSLKESFKASIGAFFNRDNENKKEVEEIKQEIEKEQKKIETQEENRDINPAKLPINE